MEIQKVLFLINEQLLSFTEFKIIWSSLYCNIFTFIVNTKVFYWLLMLLGIGLAFTINNFVKYYKLTKQFVSNQTYTKVLRQEMISLHEELLRSQSELIVQRKFIDEQNNLLRFCRQQQDQSVRIAQGVQKALLPSDQRLADVFPHAFVLFRPKAIISGDFYWVTVIGSKKFVAVADCAVHDVPGAFMSIVTYSLLNHLVKVKGLHDPAQALTQLHKQMQRLLGKEEPSKYNKIDIVFVCLENVNEQTTQLTFAGINSSLFYITANLTTAQELQGTPKLTGKFGKENILITNQQVLLPEKSSIYLCSDGYTNQPNTQHEKMGKLRVIETLQSICLYDLLSQKLLLEQAFYKHKGGEPQYDDVLVIGIRV